MTAPLLSMEKQVFVTVALPPAVCYVDLDIIFIRSASCSILVVRKNSQRPAQTLCFSGCCLQVSWVPSCKPSCLPLPWGQNVGRAQRWAFSIISVFLNCSQFILYTSSSFVMLFSQLFLNKDFLVHFVKHVSLILSSCARCVLDSYSLQPCLEMCW